MGEPMTVSEPTDSQDGAGRVLRFGAAEWDPTARRLTVRGQAVKLPWRASECLRVLVNARGAVVSKEELQRQIWNGALVEESNLAQCVTALRKALDPAPNGESHIETLARVGYRLAVPVVAEAAKPEKEEPEPASGGEARPTAGRRNWWVAGAVLVLLLALAGAGGGVYSGYRQRMARREQADALLEKGRGLMRRGSVRQGAEAQALFQQASELAPDYAPAYAALAEAAARFGKVPLEAAERLARSAVQRDPECGECQAVLGYVLGTRAWKWEEAGQHLARAAKVDPNNLFARLWYAEWLATQGRLTEALTLADGAVALRPDEPRAYAARASVRYLRGEFREAARNAEAAVALDLTFAPGHIWACRSYVQLGDDYAAVIARSQAVTTWAGAGADAENRFRETYLAVLRGKGRRGLAEAWLAEVGEGPPREVHRYDRAVWYMWIGETEKALGELEAALQSRPYHLIHVAVDPAFAAVRKEPRFQEVCRRVGLAGRRS